MVYGLFQPTQNDFVKQLLVLFVIILASIPKVYADDDDWIDGITFRLTINESKVDFRYRSTEGGKKRQVVGSSGGKYQPAHLSRTTYGFPIAIELKENLSTNP